MAYKVIRNPRTGKRTLQFHTLPRGLVAHRGMTGQRNRRVIVTRKDGTYLHATKGWRGRVRARAA